MATNPGWKAEGTGSESDKAPKKSYFKGEGGEEPISLAEPEEIAMAHQAINPAKKRERKAW